MSASIDKFEFESPKTVPSGSSIALNLEVRVSNGPFTRTLTPTAGYQVTPRQKNFGNGEHVTTLNVLITGPQGACFVDGKIDNSQQGDGVTVT